MSYKISADEFESLRLMHFSQQQVRDLCIRLDNKKEGTDDFKEARNVVETIHNTYQANYKKKPKVIKKQLTAFSLGSYKYKAKR